MGSMGFLGADPEFRSGGWLACEIMKAYSLRQILTQLWYQIRNVESFSQRICHHLE